MLCCCALSYYCRTSFVEADAKLWAALLLRSDRDEVVIAMLSELVAWMTAAAAFGGDSIYFYTDC